MHCNKDKSTTLKCKLCFMLFDSEESMEMHSKSYTFHCENCSTCFHDEDKHTDCNGELKCNFPPVENLFAEQISDPIDIQGAFTSNDLVLQVSDNNGLKDKQHQRNNNMTDGEVEMKLEENPCCNDGLPIFMNKEEVVGGLVQDNKHDNEEDDKKKLAIISRGFSG